MNDRDKAIAAGAGVVPNLSTYWAEKVIAAYEAQRRADGYDWVSTKDGVRAKAIEDAARICDEDVVVANRLHSEATDTLTKISRTTWLNTARSLAQRIRALTDSAPPVAERKENGG